MRGIQELYVLSAILFCKYRIITKIKYFCRLMRVSQKDTGGNLKELPIAKAGKI